MRNNPSFVHLFQFILILGILLSTAGCTSIRLISDYDVTIDHSSSEIQMEVETFFAKMERVTGTVEAGYVQNTDFYDDINAKLSVLKTRAEASTKNQKTIEQIELLQKSIKDLELLHKGRGDEGLSSPILSTSHTAIQVSIGAIIKLEKAKQRGDKSPDN